jgi:hypothetical protein
MALGGALMSVGMAAHYDGRVTGGGPKDFMTRKALRKGRKDWQEYSVKIGDEYVSYDRLDPFGAIIGMGADLADFIGYLPEIKEGEGERAFWAGAALIADNFTPEFLTDNAFSVLKFLNNPEKEGQKVFGQMIGAATIPFSSLAREARKITDPAKRDVKPDPNFNSMWEITKNSFMNNVPGFSDKLPPQKNIFGEVVSYPAGLGDAIASAFFSNDPKEEDSLLYKELRRLGQHGPMLRPDPLDGETHLSVLMPRRHITMSVAGKSINMKLSPEQYSKLIDYSAGVLDEGDDDSEMFEGKTLKQSLSAAVKDDFQEVMGLDKSEITDEIRRLGVKRIVQAYQKFGKFKLMQEDTSIQDRFKEERFKRAEAFGIEIEDEDLGD